MCHSKGLGIACLLVLPVLGAAEGNQWLVIAALLLLFVMMMMMGLKLREHDEGDGSGTL
jgi:hypothetical protein